jgi:hypothetical protein
MAEASLESSPAEAVTEPCAGSVEVGPVLELPAVVSVTAVVVDAVGLPSCVAVSALLVSEMAATVVVVVVSAAPVTDAAVVGAVAV